MLRHKNADLWSINAGWRLRVIVKVTMILNHHCKRSDRGPAGMGAALRIDIIPREVDLYTKFNRQASLSTRSNFQQRMHTCSLIDGLSPLSKLE